MSRSSFYDKSALAEILPEVAVAQALNGYHVFPLQPGTKVPVRGFPWRDAASCDPNLVVHQWVENFQFHNVGVVCGAVSDLTVIDLDVKNGKDGVSALENMLGLRPGELLAESPYVRTPSGGVHIYTSYSPAWGNAKLPEGIDIQNDGTYVVAPGCWLSGYEDGFYRYVAPGGRDLLTELWSAFETTLPNVDRMSSEQKRVFGSAGGTVVTLVPGGAISVPVGDAGPEWAK